MVVIDSGAGEGFEGTDTGTCTAPAQRAIAERCEDKWVKHVRDELRAIFFAIAWVGAGLVAVCT